MILQALTQHYNMLNARGEISAPGWGTPKISYELCLNEDGEVLRVSSLLREVDNGKGKTILRPRVDIQLPAAVKRSSGVNSNFLWDNSSYLLGVDTKGKPKRSIECFNAAAKLHHELLDNVDSPIAHAILSFFDTWNPEKAATHPALADDYDKIIGGANLVFSVNGKFTQSDPSIRTAWEHYYSEDADLPKQQCLISGDLEGVVAEHPFIKGVRDAQSSGAAIVTFNAESFCSYGHEQNYNAPVGKSAAFAYTTALNHLISDRAHTQYIGDTTVVYWAKTAEPQYSDLFSELCGSESKVFSESAVANALKLLAHGEPCEELDIDSNCTFYILGLAPNASRLSVRFFLKNTFGELIKNVNAHYERLELKNTPAMLPLWRLLAETVNQKSKDKKPSPVMAGAVARSIWNGDRYPAALLNGVMLRIRADSDVNWRRAAIIKAYYLKNEDKDCPKEVLLVGLNESSTNIAYSLGRLFSVYEAVQQAASPKINTTIKDKYFNSASATPAVIFPILGNLCQKHLRKLDKGLQTYYNQQIGQIKNILGENYPTRLNLPQQGSFDLGYYHQTQKRYTKKEDK